MRSESSPILSRSLPWLAGMLPGLSIVVALAVLWRAERGGLRMDPLGGVSPTVRLISRADGLPSFRSLANSGSDRLERDR